MNDQHSRGFTIIEFVVGFGILCMILIAAYTYAKTTTPSDTPATTPIPEATITSSLSPTPIASPTSTSELVTLEVTLPEEILTWDKTTDTTFIFPQYQDNFYTVDDVTTTVWEKKIASDTHTSFTFTKEFSLVEEYIQTLLDSGWEAVGGVHDDYAVFQHYYGMKGFQAREIITFYGTTGISYTDDDQYLPICPCTHTIQIQVSEIATIPIE